MYTSTNDIRHIGHIHLTTVDVYDFLFRNAISPSWYAVRKCDQFVAYNFEKYQSLIVGQVLDMFPSWLSLIFLGCNHLLSVDVATSLQDITLKNNYEMHWSY